MKSFAASERRGLTRYCSLQAHYSLMARELEHELVSLCLDQGVGVIVWSPLSGGFLTGKYSADAVGPAGARISERGFLGPLNPEVARRVLAVAEEIAHGKGASIPQVALAWLLTRSAVTSLILGARNAGQLHDTLGATELELSSDELRRLDEASERPLPYPYWHQAQFNARMRD